MKTTQILLAFAVIVLLFCSCSGEKMFNYDAIDYYRNDSLDDNGGFSEEQWQHASSFDTLKQLVAYNEFPKTLADTGFIPQLEAMGYKKRIVPPSKFETIDRILNKRSVNDDMTTSCIAVYRNILIFRKHGKVVGSIKICFSCLQNDIMGAKEQYKGFGFKGYNQLSEILYGL